MFSYGIFEIMFTIVFLLALGMMVMMIVRGIMTWNRNNQAPILTVEAKVVTKRTAASFQQTGGGGNMQGTSGFSMMHSSTYYVTFQVESGDRIELKVDGTEYGMIAEGDQGKLTFQGTRYLGFSWLSA